MIRPGGLAPQLTTACIFAGGTTVSAVVQQKVHRS
jgi:hypothetical protein